MSPLAAFWLDTVSFVGAVAIVYVVGYIFARWTAIDDARADRRKDYDWKHAREARIRFEKATGHLEDIEEIKIVWPDVRPINRRSRYSGETIDVTPHDLPPFVLARAFEKHIVYVPIDFERVQPLQWAR